MADVYLTYPPKYQTVGHMWKTGIQESITGPEKRSALFTWPRLSVQIELSLKIPAMRQWLQRKMYGHIHEVWGVPFWQDKTSLASQASSGTAVLDVASYLQRHFYEDRDCIIINPGNYLSFEVGTIDTLDSSGITLKDNLASTWPVGSYVLPVFDFRLPDSNEMKLHGYRYETSKLTFKEAFEDEVAFIYSLPSSGADTYLGYDIFLSAPLVGSEVGYFHPYELIEWLGKQYVDTLWEDKDSSSGAGAKDSRVLMGGKIIEATREDLWNLFQFFDSKMGQYDSFWVPTWQDNITVVAGFGSGDTVLTIAPIEYPEYFLKNEYIGRHVFFRFPDNTYVCKKINDATSDTITIDSAIGKEVTSGQLNDLLVSFLFYVRFAIDQLNIKYKMDTIGETKVAFSGLIGETL